MSSCTLFKIPQPPCFLSPLIVNSLHTGYLLHHAYFYQPTTSPTSPPTPSPQVQIPIPACLAPTLISAKLHTSTMTPQPLLIYSQNIQGINSPIKRAKVFRYLKSRLVDSMIPKRPGFCPHPHHVSFLITTLSFTQPLPQTSTRKSS